MARACEHSDAQWLVSLVKDRAATAKEVKKALLAQRGDPRAMFFLASAFVYDLELFLQSAQLGYAPAQAWMSSQGEDKKERFAWAEKAAAQRDRDGLFYLGNCFWKGKGGIKDKTRALRLFKEAGELELSIAEWCYGEYAFKGKDWERYYWWGRAASRGYTRGDFAGAATKHLKLIEKGTSGRVLFEIGAACKGHVDEETVFGMRCEREEIRAVKRAVVLHDESCEDAKRAIYCWIWMAHHKKLVNVIRKTVSIMLWADKGAWSNVQNGSKTKEIGQELDDRRSGTKKRVRFVFSPSCFLSPKFPAGDSRFFTAANSVFGK